MTRESFTVATWNLWWRFGDWQARQAAIRTELAALDADIIGLQEIWHDGSASLASWLADELGFHHVLAPSPLPFRWHNETEHEHIGLGNAVLSRWPIQRHEVIRLPSGDAHDEGRVALHTRIDTPHGIVPFAVTHLNAGWAQSSIRRDQLAAACAPLVDRGDGAVPPIFCGDLNADADFDEIRALSGKRDALVPDLVVLDAWNLVHPTEPGWTWDRRNPHVLATHGPSARIDYVFVGYPDEDGAGEPMDVWLFGTKDHDGVWPSDHFGVAATIRAPRRARAD